VPGLYVHVPFCFHKCHYCDFYSITRQKPDRMAAFVELVLAEADQWRAAGGPTVRPRTVFFGGGTPSLLPIDDMRRLLLGLRERFDFAGLEEWTVEANPATVTAEYAAMLREEKVDRLSFGAQSFRPEDLATLERHHAPDDVARSVELARAAGFRRLNVDLIYAIPGQDLAAWADNLDRAVALGTEHVSCYALTYEPTTPMAVKKRLGRLRAVEDEAELEMLHHTRRRLRAAGLEPYEVSNYARAGQACRHNMLYWHGEGYVGLGPSAASHVAGTRWKNRGHLREWEDAIRAGQRPVTEAEQLTPRHRAGELAMLQLRLAEGIVLADFERRCGFDAHRLFADVIERYARVGLLNVDDAAIRLTDRGLNVADAVAADFLAAAGV